MSAADNNGWRWVPVEPTEAMVDAYLEANIAYWARSDALPQKIGKWRTGTPSEATAEGYRAMLAAAPQQAAPAQPVARMHPDGRVIAEATYAHAAASGGASWSSVKDYTTPLYAAAQPMRQPLTDEHIDSMLPYVRSDQNVIGYGRAVARVVERAHGIGDAA